ncbi:hypothetical protein ACFV1L_22090 [Kitasatospora sp. NPDC059646]|uniref:hypothetical protein n=1 Tax=Kitasatospora sp. NPDC059646 TaxID=3346893 RepID=UPI0036853B38
MTRQGKGPASTHLVIRIDSAGRLVCSEQQVSGFQFLAGEQCFGYVLDGKLMHRLLSRMGMPGVWFRTWEGLLSFQERGEGYITVNHRLLAAETEISRSHISEPMAYFTDIRWLRPAGRSRYQLNPWLTYCGDSASQARFQAEWIAAVGRDFVVPSSGHPEQWRAQREEQLRAEQSQNAAVVPIKRQRKAPARRTAARAAANG